MNLHLIHDTYFMLNLSPFMCHSGKTLFEDFSNWTLAPRVQHTHTHTRTGQRISANNGEEKLAQLSSVLVPTMPRWCSPAVLLDYQCSGVMGLASQDKTNPDEVNHGGAERAALNWWKEPRHSERWECNSVVLTRVTRLTTLCLERKEQTIGFYWYTVGAAAHK